MKKLSYEYVKSYINSFDYQLISDEYVNSKSKLTLKCHNNHEFEINFGNFKFGKRCPVCYGNKKLTYDYIKEYIEKENYILLSEEYKNANDKLKLKCDKGHITYISFYDFKNQVRCSECRRNKKLTYGYVKEYIEKENYQLLSTDYKNVKQMLKLKCDKDHIFEMRFNNFQQGQRCSVCFGTPKFSFSEVKEYIEKENYQLLSTEYIDIKTKLQVKCNKGHEYKVTFDNFKNGSRCPICDRIKTSSKGEKEVLNYIKSIYSGKIIENDRTQVLNPLTNRYLELDMFLSELKFAIEYNGDYHHSKEHQILKDKIKVNQCKKLNIDLLVIKESEWKGNKNQCKNIINKHLSI